MFEIGWSELLVIAGVALVVLGPKELPNALRTVTGFARKARAVVREFQGHVEEMVKEAELSEMRKDIEKETGVADLRREVEEAASPLEELRGETAVTMDTPSIVPPRVDPPSMGAAEEDQAPAMAENLPPSNPKPA
ncbi:MAG: Sec-independent protein translocase protein TatB [Alphaproteobacteria bacterium]